MTVLVIVNLKTMHENIFINLILNELHVKRIESQFSTLVLYFKGKDSFINEEISFPRCSAL